MGQGGVCSSRWGARKGPTEKVRLEEGPTGGEESAASSLGEEHSPPGGRVNAKLWRRRSTWSTAPEARAVRLGPRLRAGRDGHQALSH